MWVRFEYISFTIHLQGKQNQNNCGFLLPTTLNLHDPHSPIFHPSTQQSQHISPLHPLPHQNHVTVLWCKSPTTHSPTHPSTI